MDDHQLFVTGCRATPNDDLSISVDIDGEDITSAPALKLLGVTIDDKLEYSRHIFAICKKASRNL